MHALPTLLLSARHKKGRTVFCSNLPRVWVGLLVSTLCWPYGGMFTNFLVCMVSLKIAAHALMSHYQCTQGSLSADRTLLRFLRKSCCHPFGGLG